MVESFGVEGLEGDSGVFQALHDGVCEGGRAAETVGAEVRKGFC